MEKEKTLAYLFHVISDEEIGNCEKFYLAFEFEVWIYQIFERDWIPIWSFINLIWIKKNWIVMNLTKYKQIFTKGWKTEIEQFIISHNFLVNIIFYSIYLQIYHSNFTQ